MIAIGTAMGRLLWWRHRGGLVTTAIVVAVLAVASPPIVGWAVARWPLSWPNLAVIVSLSSFQAIAYLMSIFLMSDGPLGDMSSGYSRRMLTRPVRSSSLALWPMGAGWASLAIVWAVLAMLVFRRCGFDVPLWWPMLALAVMMAWVQAIAWTPMPIPGVDVFVAMVVLLGQVGLALWLVIRWRAGPWVMVGLGSASLASAAVVAILGVARDRRGDGRDLPRWLEALRAAIVGRRRGRAAFASASRAQRAFEFHNHGAFLPGFAGFTMALMVVMLGLVGRLIEYDFFWKFALGQVGGLVFLAGSAGAALPKFAPFWQPKERCEIFLMTRPVPTGAFVAAKLSASLRSVLVGFAILVGGLLVGLSLDGYGGHFLRMARDLNRLAPGGRAVGIVVLGGLGTIVLAFRQMTDGLVLGLSGRKILADLSVLGFFFLLMAAVGAGFWFQTHPEHVPIFLKMLPGGIVATLAIKLGVTAWAFRRATRRNLLETGSAARAVVGFALVTTILIGLTVLTVPPDLLPASPSMIAAGIALVVPIGRYPLATLALDGARHR